MINNSVFEMTANRNFWYMTFKLYNSSAASLSLVPSVEALTFLLYDL